MSLPLGIALYVTIWWTVLFAVLPIGTRPVTQADSETGWRGVPEAPGMLRKVLLTTAISALIWLFAWWLMATPLFSFRHGWLAMPDN
jgi:predicted secreted protein